MDDSGFSIHRMKLRAFDLSERTARWGAASLDRRTNRWKARVFMIIQCAVTAGLAWWLAQNVLGHATPFFAPVAAIVCLGFSFGQRLRRGLEVSVGVAVGVLTGELFVHIFGTGVWQIVIVCFIAMSLATLLGAGNLMIIQAGVQSIIVITLSSNADQGISRWLDAVIGCAIALVVATIAPSAPLRRPRLLAAASLQRMAETVTAAHNALRDGDADAADAVLEQARSSNHDLAELDEAVTEGLAVVRYSPFRRGQLPAVQAYAELYEPLDRASRNLRVLSRRSAVVLWRDQTVPRTYLDLMERLAEIMRYMAGELYDRRLPVSAQARLIALGKESADVPIHDTISSVVILAQLRSIMVDLLELTGMDYADARDAVPEVN